MLCYCLSHFSISLLHFCLICSLSHSPIYFLALSSCSLREMGRYVNCFLLDVCPACYLSILMNSFPPFFSQKLGIAALKQHQKTPGPKVSCHVSATFYVFLCDQNAYRNLPFNVLVVSLFAVVRLSFGSLRLD